LRFYRKRSTFWQAGILRFFVARSIKQNKKNGRVMNLLYKLDDDVPRNKFLVYSLQHVVLFISGGIALVVVVGISIGLTGPELSALMRRTFFISGVFSVLQGFWGHRYPIVDGPAALWVSMILLIVPTVKGHVDTFLTDLETGVMIGGALVVVITVAGLMPYVFKLFTSPVNGVLLMLMVIQISPSIARGMTGISSTNGYINGASVIVFFFTAAALLVLNAATKGFLKSIAVLTGTIVGWLFAIPMGLASAPASGAGFLSLPAIFAFGRPTWNPGIVIVCVFASFVLLSMVNASIIGMSEIVDKKIDGQGMKKGVLFHGIAAVLAGVFSMVPNLPYITPIGMISMTGVAARKPFLAGGLIMIVMGAISPVGALFAAIPIPVGYATMTVLFALIFKQGLHEVQKDADRFPDRIGYVVGIAMIIGVGVMFLPFEAFLDLPGVLPYLLSNGLIDGTVIAIILDKALLRR